MGHPALVDEKAIAKELPSQEELRQMFDFMPETGDLIWRVRDDRDNAWNGRMAGKRVGAKSKDGYMRSQIGEKQYAVHRLIWKLAYGQIPSHMQVDHINGIRDDNRLDNLRLCDNRQNQFNRNCDKGRGYKGVYRHRRRWKAEITTPEGRKYLGLYKTPEEAAIAFDAAARQWHGEHAKLNFPNVYDAAA